MQAIERAVRLTFSLQKKEQQVLVRLKKMLHF